MHNYVEVDYAWIVNIIIHFRCSYGGHVIYRKWRKEEEGEDYIGGGGGGTTGGRGGKRG